MSNIAKDQACSRGGDQRVGLFSGSRFRDSVLVLGAGVMLCAGRLPGQAATEPPVIPIGLDPYRMWERWPYQRIGARAYMRSTYDRRGGNEGADASHFLYQLAEDYNVTLAVEGAGVLYFVRCNHWHGSPWHYEIDGADHLVRETSTADPNHPAPNSVFIPEKLFPHPLTWTWSITRGADLNWVPLAFERSLRLAYSRTRYGTGYYIYHLYDPSAKLSQPVRTWDGRSAPAADVLELIARAGTDLAPPGLPVREGRCRLGAGSSTVVALREGPGMIRAIEISAPREQAIALGRARLRLTWDGLGQPSVDAPVALFFGAGTLYNRDGREFLVKAFPVHVCFDAERVHLGCYFPMPYFRSAKLELAGMDELEVGDVRYAIRVARFDDPWHQVAYFHATYRDHPQPQLGKDLVLLDTREVEGGGQWSGHFIGTSWIFSHRAVLNTLEGDPRFFFDDSQTPQAYGTGTEEWGGGGDYWGGRTMTLPFAGHPCGARNAKEAKNGEDQVESAYRFLLADLMPFGNRAVIRLEHGGQNESTEHYETVTYWYGMNAPTLIKTDELKIGDTNTEAAHDYVSPQASAPYEITSRYEWGPDMFQGQEVYPAHTDRGRKTQTVSEFTLKLREDNFGVILRRKLDYALPNQRAEVFVAEAPGPVERIPEGAWQPAGIWYLAGGNTCVYSNPKEELGAAQHIVQTSNRRFRDDEFIVPRALTRGEGAIRVRVKWAPLRLPLFPGQEPPESAWSEIRYDAFCYVLPRIPKRGR